MLCLFRLHRRVGVKNLHAHEDGTDRVFRNVGIYISDAEEITQKKAYNIQNMVKVWNQEHKTVP